MSEVEPGGQTHKEIRFRAITPEVSLPWDNSRIQVIEKDLNGTMGPTKLNADQLAYVCDIGRSLPGYIEAQRMFVRTSISEIEDVPIEKLVNPEETEKAIEAAYEITLRKLQDRGMIEILPDETA